MSCDLDVVRFGRRWLERNHWEFGLLALLLHPNDHWRTFENFEPVPFITLRSVVIDVERSCLHWSIVNRRTGQSVEEGSDREVMN